MQCMDCHKTSEIILLGATREFCSSRALGLMTAPGLKHIAKQMEVPVRFRS